MGYHSTDRPAGTGHIVETANAVCMREVDIFFICRQSSQFRHHIIGQAAAHIFRHICIFHGFQKNIDQITFFLRESDLCLKGIHIFFLINGRLLADIVNISGQVNRHRRTQKHHTGKHQRNDARAFFCKRIDFFAIAPFCPEEQCQYHKGYQCRQKSCQHIITNNCRIRTAHFRKQCIQDGIEACIPEFCDIPSGRKETKAPQKQQHDAADEDRHILFVIIIFVHKNSS